MLIFVSLTDHYVWDYDLLCLVQIDAVSGVLRIRKELDFEKQQLFNLTVAAEDRGVPSLKSQTFVELEVCKSKLMFLMLPSFVFLVKKENLLHFSSVHFIL